MGVSHIAAAANTTEPCGRRQTIASRARCANVRGALSDDGLQTAFAADTVRAPTHGARMSDQPIAAIELHHVALPTRREHKWTGLTEPIGGYVLVKMTDAAGGAGWGEAPALKDWGGDFGRYFGESPGTTIEVITRYLAPAVKGGLPGDIAELHARMDRSIKGYPYAKAAVEFAAYDLAGRQWGLPVHRLLGGAVRRRIPVTHSIGLIGADEAEREVVQVAQEGVRTIKIKVGVDPDRDVEMVRRIRETVGQGVALCVDANQGYRTPGEAIRTYRRMERFDLIFFEQPVEGVAGLAEVARAIDTPVMADESAWNAHDVIEIIEKRAAQIVSIYTTKPGGLYRAMEVAAVARAAGLICNVNGSVETGIGNLANLQLAAAAPAAVLSCVVPVSTPAEAQSGQVAGIYYKDDLIAAPMRFIDGAIELPVGAGMGIAADEAKIRRYGVGGKG
jgi:muconate cycloisomerase